MGVPWTRDMVKFLFGDKQSSDKQIKKIRKVRRNEIFYKRIY